MFHVIFGLPWLVVFSRFILPMPWPWPVRIAVGLVLFLACQYHFFSRLSSGSVFAPEFSRSLIIAFNLLFGATVLLAIFQLALDVACLAIAPFKGHLVQVPPALRYGIGLAALALAGFGVSQAIRVPPLRDVEIEIAGLPPAFDGYTMVQLTDLHLSRLFPAAWAQKVVDRTNALDADLIVITGDLIDGSLESRLKDVAPLAGLRARDGVYTIPGNHEYFFDYTAWMRHYSSLGMTVLENAHGIVRRDGAALVIAGVTDLSARATGAPGPDLGRALAGAPPAVPVLLLDHQPRTAIGNARLGVAAQFSGHTHGGMIVGLDRLVARGNNGFVSGFYDVDGMKLYVNNGTALWPGFALRIGVPSELTRFTLRTKR